jgi:N-acetylneuraminate synthase/sialic acid synthase
MTRKLKIFKQTITQDSDCFFVAEIGANHCGSVETAKKLIDMCKLAGANAVKFQKRSNKKLFTKKIYDSTYDNRNSYGRTYGEHREKLELSIKQFKQLKKYSTKKNILFMCTPFDLESVDELKSINLQAYKIASADITNLPLIKKIAKNMKPTFMSTGCATMQQVLRAHKEFTKINKNLCLMQCTSIYPPKYDQFHLNVIDTYMNKFKNTIIGLSSHESGIAMDLVAFVKGARVIEKHVTLNRAMKGTDHAFSLEFVGLKKTIEYLTNAKKAFGLSSKHQMQEEKEKLKKQVKSIVASKNILPNQTINIQDVSFKVNGGDGLDPSYLDKFIGKRVKKKLFKDDPFLISNIKN